ncbi:MAG: hypothetical protein WBN83_00275 [Desulfoprunum sp.]
MSRISRIIAPGPPSGFARRGPSRSPACSAEAERRPCRNMLTFTATRPR